MCPEIRHVRLSTQAPSREDRSDHAGQRWRRSCSLSLALSPRHSLLCRLIAQQRPRASKQFRQFSTPRDPFSFLALHEPGVGGHRVTYDNRAYERRSVPSVTVRQRLSIALLIPDRTLATLVTATH